MLELRQVRKRGLGTEQQKDAQRSAQHISDQALIHVRHDQPAHAHADRPVLADKNDGDADQQAQRPKLANWNSVASA